MLFGLLAWQDILYAAVLALCITYIVLKLSGSLKSFKKSFLEMDYNKAELTAVIERCYSLFPKEMFMFKGEVFKRGVKIRVITNQNKIFEGQFLGYNSDNMICIMTKKYIIAYALNNIDEIEVINSGK